MAELQVIARDCKHLTELERNKRPDNGTIKRINTRVEQNTQALESLRKEVERLANAEAQTNEVGEVVSY